ncbi:MAG: ComEC/Rec2 family competence protein [Oscillospiraceae bacterium]|nr:ComEC/Rec2 family competence protein [Oscillospiraceae bacterium]
MKIKRPLFIIALAMLVVIYAINTMPGSMFFGCSALFVAFIIIHKLTKNKYTYHLILFVLAASIAAGYLSFYNSYLKSKILSIEATGNTVATGVVVEENLSSTSINYTIALKSFNKEKIHLFKVKLYTGEVLKTGDSVELTGKFKGFTPKSNYIYNYSNGIYGYFYADKITVLDKEQSVFNVFNQIRISLVDNSRKIFNYKSVPIAVAMGLGEKSLLDTPTVNGFTFTGLTHALVVSGRHIGFIVTAINMLLYYIPVKKKLKNIVLSLFLIFFMGLMGFTPSVIRAGVLMVAILIGKNFFLEIDNYTVLALIIIITLIFNPYSAHSGSLLLSYSAYFGVIKRFEISSEKEFNKIITSFTAAVPGKRRKNTDG